MTKLRLDGYASALIGNRRAQNAIYRSPEQLYAKGGLFARLVDKPADDAVSGSLTIDGDNGTLAAELDRLNAQSLLADAVRWCRLSGGAAIVPLTDDSDDLMQPLDPAKIGSIAELRVYSAAEVSIFGNPYNDPTQANYGKPAAYQIASGAQSFTLHESRLIPLAGATLPRTINHNNIWWQGRSETERPYQTLIELINALGRVGDILERKQQPVYSMTGLAEAISNGFETEVQKRVALTDDVRGIRNTVAIDGEDTYTILDLGLSGLPETVNLFKEQLAADSSIPISILFGRAAQGLNATGEGDFRAYYDLIDGIRNRQIRPALERLIALIAAQNTIKNQVADNWRVVFPPLFEPSAKEQAEIAKIQADTLSVLVQTGAAAVDLGALSETELREYLAAQSLLGLSGQTDGAEDYAGQTHV